MQALQESAASSSTQDREDFDEEKDFIETHCHWINCDREFGTQDQLVKVCKTTAALFLRNIFNALQSRNLAICDISSNS